MQLRLFNKALFEVGDVVRSRHPQGRVTGEVTKDELITNVDGLQFQIIWIGDDFYSAWDFEPTNLAERKAYYAEYAKHGVKAKRLVKTTVHKKKMTLNLAKLKGNDNKE